MAEAARLDLLESVESRDRMAWGQWILIRGFTWIILFMLPQLIRYLPRGESAGRTMEKGQPVLKLKILNDRV